MSIAQRAEGLSEDRFSLIKSARGKGETNCGAAASATNVKSSGGIYELRENKFGEFKTLEY